MPRADIKVEPISLLNLSASSSRSGFPKALLTAVDIMSRNLIRRVGGLGLNILNYNLEIIIVKNDIPGLGRSGFK